MDASTITAIKSEQASAAEGTRTCGGCTACCKVMSIASIGKAPGQHCSHECDDGCGIYSERPTACRDFTCMWLRDGKGILSDAHRPDRVGLVLTATVATDGQPQVVLAHEVLPGSADEPEAKALMDYLRQFVPVRILPARPPVKITLRGGQLGRAPGRSYNRFPVLRLHHEESSSE